MKIFNCLDCNIEIARIHKTKRCKRCTKKHIRILNNLWRRTAYNTKPDFKILAKERNAVWRKNNPEKVKAINSKAMKKYLSKKKLIK